MVIRQRAIHSEDKHERHHAILDAAERLLARGAMRVANMAEVADEAGLAKGTVYLYFPSKDELLLALHERHSEEFFRALIGVLARSRRVTVEEIMEITRSHMVLRPTFLPLASRCFGLVDTEVPREVALAFKERMAARLAAAAAGLERHFPQLSPGAGVALLRYSYALIVGLWQMTAGAANPAAPADTPAACGIEKHDYPQELERALLALWSGMIAEAALRRAPVAEGVL
jgi:AcrR family transcriptional regulator